MQIGIIGLQSSGKSTIFQTLTEIHFDSNNSSKKESNQAIVKINDKRLDILTDIFQPKKKVNATIEIVDIVSIQKGDGKSSSFNSQTINKIKNNDAIIHIVRGFENDSIPHPNISIDM